MSKHSSLNIKHEKLRKEINYACLGERVMANEERFENCNWTVINMRVNSFLSNNYISLSLMCKHEVLRKETMKKLKENIQALDSSSQTIRKISTNEFIIVKSLW